MVKIREDAELTRKSRDLFSTSQFVVGNMEVKRGKLLLDWLNVQNTYWKWEETFDPTKLINYNRADIIYVNLGFNVGAEFGGYHYGVVTVDSPKKNPVVNIIPLSSLETDESEDDLHRDDVFLGILPINGKRAFAIPNQMRPVSKLRIYKPRTIHDKIGKLTALQMDLIDNKVLSMYTKIKIK